MNLAHNHRIAGHAARPSLGNMIAGLQSKFDNISVELREAHLEIALLKAELVLSKSRTSSTSSTGEFPEQNLRALRRHLAFYCHPDRGGNELLMRRLNVLFDFLENSSR